MKNYVLRYGLIAGSIVTAMMLGTTIACYNNQNFESNMFLGYASMLLAFAFIFLAIKKVRDKGVGTISFGAAFKIGLYVTLIASTMYVVVWLFEYYLFMPDFMEKYTAHVLREAAADGASAAELREKTTEMDKYSEMYKNPLYVVLLSYLEIIPIGLIVTLISALILKRNKPVL